MTETTEERHAREKREMDVNETRFLAVLEFLENMGRGDWAQNLRSYNSMRTQPARMSLATLEDMVFTVENTETILRSTMNAGVTYAQEVQRLEGVLEAIKRTLEFEIAAAEGYTEHAEPEELVLRGQIFGMKRALAIIKSKEKKEDER